MLVFGTMYILDENDRLWRVNDAPPCNELATDGQRLNSVHISSNYRNEMFEVQFLRQFKNVVYSFSSTQVFFSFLISRQQLVRVKQINTKQQQCQRLSDESR